MDENKIIGTIEISHAIEKMIDESYKFLIFISPYLKITDRLRAKFSDSYGRISSVIEPYQDFTVGKLYNKLRDITDKYFYSGFPGDSYIRFCNDVRKIIELSVDELYQDKTAILRGTNLGRARYEKILNILK